VQSQRYNVAFDILFQLQGLSLQRREMNRHQTTCGLRREFLKIRPAD